MVYTDSKGFVYWEEIEIRKYIDGGACIISGTE